MLLDIDQLTEHDLTAILNGACFGGALRGLLDLKTASDENWAAAVLLAVRHVLGDDLHEGAAVKITATANDLRRSMAAHGRDRALAAYLAQYRDGDGGNRS